MINWWNSLMLSQQIFACIAIPSTVIVLIQTVLLLIGIGDDSGSEGADFDEDGVPDGGDGDGLTLFTVRGITTMLAVTGWSGMALLETALPDIVSVVISIVLGIAMLYSPVEPNAPSSRSLPSSVTKSAMTTGWITS